MIHVKMVDVESVNGVLSAGELAVIGVSRNPKKFGYLIFKHLKKRGYTVYAVNPTAVSIAGDRCYSSAEELPESVRSVVLVTPPSQTLGVVDQVLRRGIINIWIQKGAETKEAIDLGLAANAKLVWGECIFMYTAPKGIHKLHASIARWRGRYIE